MGKIVDKKFVYGKIPLREENSNKSTFGRIINIAGSIEYIGAAYLSSISALRVGAGYLTLGCIEELVPIIASMAPEITYKRLKSKNGTICVDNDVDIQSYNVISLGCGITNTLETQAFVLEILKKRSFKQALVLDADGINILAAKKGDISLKNTVITPHPKELSRLLGIEVSEILSNREKYARLASNSYDCITVLKGHNSIITDGKDIYVNTTGSSALAKAGSGDVLTGIIAGLLAQKVEILDAAILGVYIHGLSGDIAAEDLTKYSVLATDVIEYLPLAIQKLLHD